MAKRDQERTGDVLVLNTDGTVRIGWDGQPAVLLRRPKIARIRDYAEEYDRCREWQLELSSIGDDGQPVTTIADMYGEANPYIALYRSILEENASLTVDWDDMPPWMFSSGLFTQLLGHWSGTPLARGLAAAAAGTRSR